MNRRHTLSVFLSFFVGVAVAVFLTWLVHGGIDRVFFPVHRQEVARVTSPDGAVDAVMENMDCGAPCPSEYSVSVVAKGGSVPTDRTQYVFLAADAVSLQIRWKQPHLLEIAYDRAFIDSFRNVTYPLGTAGNEESWRYGVEIRLAPSSTGFSYLENGDKSGDSR